MRIFKHPIFNCPVQIMMIPQSFKFLRVCEEKDSFGMFEVLTPEEETRAIQVCLILVRSYQLISDDLIFAGMIQDYYVFYCEYRIYRLSKHLELNAEGYCKECGGHCRGI